MIERSEGSAVKYETVAEAYRHLEPADADRHLRGEIPPLPASAAAPPESVSGG
jgi:hypothetical protein